MASRGEVALKVNRGWLLVRFPVHEAVPETYWRKCMGLGLKDDPAGRAQAEAIAKFYTADILREDFNPHRHIPQANQKVVRKFEPTVSALLTEYVEQKRASQSTLVKDRIDVRRVAGLIGSKKASEIGSKDVSRVKATVTTLRARGQRGVLNLCCSAWEWAGIVPNPWQGSTRGIKGEVKPPKPFTAHEAAAITAAFEAEKLKYPDGKMRPNSYRHYASFVRFLLLTGLRPGEARALRWENVNLHQGTLTIADSMDSSNHPKGGTKTRRSRRTLSLPEAVVISLSALPRTCEILFPSPRGHYLDQHNFTARAWRTCLRAAGVEYRSTYTIRKTALTKWVGDGIPLNIVAALGGTSIEMLSRHYVGVTEELKLPNA